MWLKHSQNKHTLYKVTKFWSLELFGCIFHLRPMFIVCKRNKKGIIKRKEWRMSSECKKKKKNTVGGFKPHPPPQRNLSLSLSDSCSCIDVTFWKNKLNSCTRKNFFNCSSTSDLDDKTNYIFSSFDNV